MDFGITGWNHPFLRNTAMCELILCTSLRESSSELLSLRGGGQTPEGPNSRRTGRAMGTAHWGQAGAEPERTEGPEHGNCEL